jgi:hypothetical protein
MSDDSSTIERRIKILENLGVRGSHVDSLREQLPDHGDAPATTAGVKANGDAVVEALRAVDAEVLQDSEAIEAEAARLERKLDMLGSALPAARRRDLEARREALSAAAEAYSPHQANTPAALAERLEVSD